MKVTLIFWSSTYITDRTQKPTQNNRMILLLLIVFACLAIRQTAAFGPHFGPGGPLMQPHFIGPPIYPMEMHAALTMHNAAKMMARVPVGPNLSAPSMLQQDMFRSIPNTALQQNFRPLQQQTQTYMRPLPQVPNRQIVDRPSRGRMPSQSRLYPPQRISPQRRRQISDTKRILIIRPNMAQELPYNRNEGYAKPRLVPYNPGVSRTREINNNGNFNNGRTMEINNNGNFNNGRRMEINNNGNFNNGRTREINNNGNFNNGNEFRGGPGRQDLNFETLKGLPVFNDNSWNYIDQGGVDFSRGGPGVRGKFPGPRPGFKGRPSSAIIDARGSILVPRHGEFNELDKIRKNINVNRNNNKFQGGPPNMREVIDTDIRVEISKNSVESSKAQASVSRHSLRSKSSDNGVQRTLAGKTLDFTGSTVIGSSRSKVGQTTSKASSGDIVHRKQSNNNSNNLNNNDGNNINNSNKNKNNNNNIDIKNKNINSNGRKGRIDLSNVQTPIAVPKKVSPFSGLGGSVIDFTGIGSGSAGTSGGLAKAQAQAEAQASTAKAAAASASASLPTGADSASAVAGMSAASAAAELNGQVLSSVTDLLGSGDVVIIDNVGQTMPLPADVGAPTPASALANVVDLNATPGTLNGANIGDFGAVDIVTLDNAAFAQLEQALQSGQAVSAQLLDSIIGGGAGSGGTAIGSAGQGMVDLSLIDTAAPQIYLLDGAQAQQIANAVDLLGPGSKLHHVPGGPPNPVVDAHVNLSSLSSSSSKQTSNSSKKSSKTSSTHTVASIPHAGAVMPGHQGQVPAGGHGSHDIVGVVGEPVGSITVDANTDIVGLFGVPSGPNFPKIPASVASIPKSIGHRMQGQGQGPGGHAAHK